MSAPYLPSPACNCCKKANAELGKPKGSSQLQRGSSGNAKEAWWRIHSGGNNRYWSDIWFPGATGLVMPVMGGASVQCHWIGSENWGTLCWMVVAVMATSLNMLYCDLGCDPSCCPDFLVFAYCRNLILQPSQQLCQHPNSFSTNSFLLKSAMSTSSVACN